MATAAVHQGDFDLIMIQDPVNFPLRPPPKSGLRFAKDICAMRSYEEHALRGLLSAETSPAVLFVEWMRGEGQNYKYATAQAASQDNGMMYRAGTWQDESSTFLAKYYEVPMVSVGMLCSTP
ncbi:unnamed protein product [Polarella glacialis]|uniref:Uncharacterized protein n=1 Tax=Polarella glacialis TaxID=89957 RepID=A0A813E3U4_POLGL|nr:unnamed protein product [Polarella glacialis]